tara:strand:+ start:2324 stop:2824 length:501 start_codon:yes stop_codon:yes gene_type:complete
MVMSITDVLNLWAEMGVFSYVLPFLLIFAVVFAILKKTQILGKKDDKPDAINAIIAIAIGLLALLNDHVPVFFENIFPKFGIGLSIFLVLIILIGFFYHPTGEENRHPIKWIGYLTGIGVVVWAVTSWDDWGLGGYGISSWLSDYFWSLIILAGVITVIVLVTRDK